MKHLLLLIYLLPALALSQASLPDSIASKPVTITFRGKNHALIYALMADKGSADAINYVNQVTGAVKLRNLRNTQGDLVFDTAQQIAVTITYQMVASTYYLLGCQQNRLVAKDNEELTTSLRQQLYKPEYIDLLQEIGRIADQSKAETESLRQNGVDAVMKVYHLETRMSSKLSPAAPVYPPLPIFGKLYTYDTEHHKTGTDYHRPRASRAGPGTDPASYQVRAYTGNATTPGFIPYVHCPGSLRDCWRRYTAGYEAY